ncbi:PREDICTED: C-type Lectin CRL-like [Thamnophis sirtalis]|uniref:C-type Lectin CRL-like n=1 Tax=Thamnophis sirtalis TaxID=35019 RepID=A0A6I9Y129_9SAUR|nr:PREDICTED: C-type Lectin CRL-like [Thamnophis sirtalis]
MNSISSSMLTGYEENFRIWIGLYKIRGGKLRLRWLDASVVSYTPWARNQPSNCKRNQKCVELYANDYKAWNDQFCNIEQPYLCKMPMY